MLWKRRHRDEIPDTYRHRRWRQQHLGTEHILSKSPTSRPVRVRSSLRYMARSGFPEVIGWPFSRIDIYDDVLVFSVGRGVPFQRALGSPDLRVRRDQIRKVERTQRGVRFYADGFEDPWVTASIFAKYFLRRLAENGIVPEGPIVPSRWDTI